MKHDHGILLLRIGLAFVFIYAAIASFITPENWIGFFPPWVRTISPVSDAILLGAFSVGELILAGFLLIQKRPFYASLVAGILLLGMVFTNLGVLDVVFRDVGLALSAFALAILSKSSAVTAEETTHE